LFAHRTQRRGDGATTATSATATTGQRETAITTARPSTATAETDNTSATEKHAKNTHFSPAKAMTVSVEARPTRAKATPVSRERFPMPAGYGGAWPGDRWAADVTNVVKPTRFKSPHEDPCDKRRQSKPKNHHYQRKSPQIDDVRNNGTEIHTKNTLD